jgi:hypothetical protein
LPAKFHQNFEQLKPEVRGIPGGFTEMETMFMSVPTQLVIRIPILEITMSEKLVMSLPLSLAQPVGRLKGSITFKWRHEFQPVEVFCISGNRSDPC